MDADQRAYLAAEFAEILKTLKSEGSKEDFDIVDIILAVRRVRERVGPDILDMYLLLLVQHFGDLWAEAKDLPDGRWPEIHAKAVDLTSLGASVDEAMRAALDDKDQGE